MMRFITFFAVIVFANATGLYSLGDLTSYGLGDGSLSRQEIRSPDGIVRGTLTYIDGDGKIKSISYGGDNDAEALKPSTEAPMKAEAERGGEEEQQTQTKEDTPKQSEEMKEESTDASSTENNNEKETATNEDNGNGNGNGNAESTLPQPVAYTPEVAAARAAHFAARDQAILLQQLAANQEQLEANQQQLLNQPQILEYPPIFREYYGAAKPLKTLNPYYYL